MSPRQWDLDEDLPQLCRGQPGANDRAMKIVADFPDTPPCGLCGCCLRRCASVEKNGPRSRADLDWQHRQAGGQTWQFHRHAWIYSPQYSEFQRKPPRPNSASLWPSTTGTTGASRQHDSCPHQELVGPFSSPAHNMLHCPLDLSTQYRKFTTFILVFNQLSSILMPQRGPPSPPVAHDLLLCGVYAAGESNGPSALQSAEY